MAVTGDECRAAGKQQFCARGHDTYLVGRAGRRGGRCLECNREAGRAWANSDAGQEWHREYRASGKAAEAQARHKQTERFRVTRARLQGWGSERTRRKRAEAQALDDARHATTRGATA